MEDELLEKAERFIDRPKKEKRIHKDADLFKTYDEVFDQRTLKFLTQLISKHIIDTLDAPISTGKEANTFIATEPTGGRVVVKIFRVNTATFRALNKYIDGDSRFMNTKKSHVEVIYTWCRKEYQNLIRMCDADLRVPEPIHYFRNILVQDMVRLEDMPAPPLKECALDEEEAKEIYDFLMDFIRRSYIDAGLVHADLSEYNVLMGDDGPVVIDVGQAVLVDHPAAEEFLLRDINNVNRFFRQLEGKLDAKEYRKSIIEEARLK